MLLRIALKDLREISRDLYTVCVLGIYVAVLSFSCLAYDAAWSSEFEKQFRLQQQSREAWLTQETNSPHLATHRGTAVYKLPSPLAGFDPGTAPELGTTVELESHKRHDAVLAASEDDVSLLQLDMSTPALLMQAVLPLITVFLSHAVVSRESASGTWVLVSSLGVSQRQFVLGKLTALCLLCLVLCSPVLLLLLRTIIFRSTETDLSLADAPARCIAVYLVSVLYLLGWCALGTALSARFSSGTSLMILLTCWALWTLIIPRVAVDLANSRFPLPRRHRLLEFREEAIRQGSNGRVSLEEMTAALEKRLLAEYKVTDMKDLPIDVNAAQLLAMEEFTDAVDDDIQWKIEQTWQQQNRFLDRFMFVSPYLAVRAVSSSFAGTDRHHHAAFIDSAEEYRRTLVETMNRAEMQGERPGKTPELSRRFWSRVPEYRQRQPALAAVLNAMREQISVLVAWCALMLFFTMLPGSVRHA